MRAYEATITRTERRSTSITRIEFLCGEIARNAVPGQFVQVRTTTGTDPFLRRTISIADVDPGGGLVTLLVDAVGPGTDLMCGAPSGGSIDLIGPLGKGFDLTLGGDGACLLVAGGIGAAPLIFLGRALGASGRRVTVLMGGRDAVAIETVRELLAGDDIRFATDDGSIGHHGFVSGLMDKVLAESLPAAIYACGPQPMMRTVARIAGDTGVPCQVSLEERMACGIGACYGCAVERLDGSILRACFDGPVFNAGEIIL